MELTEDKRRYCTTINGTYIEFAKRRRIQIQENGEIYFYCTKCNQYKSFDHFELQKNSNGIKCRVRSDCKLCRTKESRDYHFFRRRRYTEEYGKDRMIHLDKLKHDVNYHTAMIMLQHAKQHAKKLNCEFSITINDFTIPEKCPILNVPMTFLDKRYAPSLDRIDSTKGYIPDNVAVISRKANTMKNDGTYKELLAFSKNIKKYLKK